MPDHELRVSAQPAAALIVISSGPFSMFLKADEAHTVIDQLQAALRDLAAKEANHDH